MVAFTRNERQMLKMLVANARTTDVAVAKKLKITPQAAGKIRKKLEDAGVIEGYTTQLNYKKIGVNVFAIAIFRIRPETWRTMSEDVIKSRVRGPHIIDFYRLTEGAVTHLLVYGFRSMDDLDHYFHVLQTEHGHISELRRLYILSANSLVKRNPQELINKILDEMGRENPPRPIPAGEIKTKRKRADQPIPAEAHYTLD